MILLAAPAGLLGLVLGSFLNVVVWRVPRGESVVHPPSACPRCGHAVRARDNVPVLSWLLLRARCRDCGEPISARYPAVEAVTAVAFVGVLVWQGLGWSLPAFWYLAAVSIALALIDLDVRRLPNAIVLPAYPLLGILLAVSADWHDLARAAAGGLLLFSLFFLVALAAPGGMGFGDVKLAGVVGAMTAYLSWGAFMIGAFGGFLLGALAGVLLIAGRRAGRGSAVPFGPFMLLGAWASILGASGLGDVYLQRLGG